MTNVRIFSTPTCPWCVRAKDFFSSNNIDFEDVDVSRDQAAANEMVQLSGQMGVPVIQIGSEVIVGFDQARIENTLIR